MTSKKSKANGGYSYMRDSCVRITTGGNFLKHLQKEEKTLFYMGGKEVRRKQKAYIVNTNGFLLFLSSYFYSLRKAGHEVLQRLIGFSPFPGGQDLDVESQKFPAVRSKANLFPVLLRFHNMYRPLSHRIFCLRDPT